ncbi:hypothetical protein ACSBLW_04700 [Thioclava sp. FR2]|uniref:hypothetical protein n=1 Tax=Thioclava sp. FR2 TaxID=3445780 RepID=UPI003EB94C76
MAAAAVCISTSMVSAETIYDCSFNDPGNSSWIPAQVVFVTTPDTSEILVADPIIQYFTKKKTIVGAIKSDSAAKLTVGWTVKARDNAGQLATLVYRVSYFKAKKNAFITMQAQGYTNQTRGDGSCKIKER